MAEYTNPPPSSSSPSTSRTKKSLISSSCLLSLSSAVFVPLLAASFLLYRVDPFDPAPFPTHELTHRKLRAPLRVDGRMLLKSGFVGSGRVMGPEDVAYEPVSRAVYTGCVDGWIKRVELGESGPDSVVEDWVNTGGRPLGLAIAGGEVIVADAYKGLLKITKDKELKLLTNEAEGQKFKLADGVDVAKDGTIYFTDASYKYNFKDHLLDIMGNRPYGRLLSYNPHTQETKVLLRDLYFANGVALSPDQNSLIFCETPLNRCRRHWLQGSKKGSTDAFIDNLPGYPDNIHFDGQNNYWIAISSSLPPFLDRVSRHRLVRKGIVIVDKYIGLHHILRNGGVFAVDLEGNPTAHFYDPAMLHISSGIEIEDHLYIGSLHLPHIIRYNLTSS